MLFGLKIIISKFQRIMNKIFNLYTKFIIVYIDNVFVFSTSIEQHFKYIQIFLDAVLKNSLVFTTRK